MQRTGTLIVDESTAHWIGVRQGPSVTDIGRLAGLQREDVGRGRRDKMGAVPHGVRQKLIALRGDKTKRYIESAS